MSSRVHKRDSTLNACREPWPCPDRRHATPTTGVALLARGAGTGGGGAAAAFSCLVGEGADYGGYVPDER